MQGLIRELADMVEQANRAAEAYRKGPRVVVWDPDLRRGATMGTYRWEDGGRDAYKCFWEDTERRVNRGRLEVICGFLNYVVQSYPWMNLCIKGLHLTIDGWRPGRVTGVRIKPCRTCCDSLPLAPHPRSDIMRGALQWLITCLGTHQGKALDQPSLTQTG